MRRKSSTNEGHADREHPSRVPSRAAGGARCASRRVVLLEGTCELDAAPSYFVADPAGKNHSA